jgi:hypothetical protein
MILRYMSLKTIATSRPQQYPSSNCRPRSARAVALTAALAGWTMAVGVAAAAELQVVASGLNNPRGLDFAPNGAGAGEIVRVSL